MPRFQLKPKCLFVDALVHKKPEAGDYHPPFPHIMDGRTSPPEYSGLNDTAGLIAHFIVEGVDTDTLLPQIVQSEYGITLEEAKQEVEKVKNDLMPYLEPRSYRRPHHEPICNLVLPVLKIIV